MLDTSHVLCMICSVLAYSALRVACGVVTTVCFEMCVLWDTAFAMLCAVSRLQLYMLRDHVSASLFLVMRDY